MTATGTVNMSPAQLRHEIERGGRFVIFEYCISILVLSFKRVSGVHLIKVEDSAFRKGALYSAISLLLGWWGIPWGPIWTVSTLVTNCRGGRDITSEVMQALANRAA